MGWVGDGECGLDADVMCRINLIGSQETAWDLWYVSHELSAKRLKIC